MKPSEQLKSGDYNTIEQIWQEDGTVIVIVAKRGQGRSLAAHYSKYGEKDQQLLVEEETL